MYRTFVIARHTFIEAIVQPIYALLLALGGVILCIFGLLPFFTLGEDTVMYKSVGLDVILLLVLIATLFATSRSIFEEIEDRTMLTLMSKPVRKWEVLVGKYLGICLSALLAILVLGGILILCTALRLPGDYQLRTRSIDENEIRQIYEMRLMNILGLIPSLFLMWLQISVLAAIGVALSTRFSLVVNLPVVILLYIAGNLTRFLFPQTGRGPLSRVFVYLLSLILPYLETFDLRQKTVYSTIKLAGTMYATDPRGVGLGEIWAYTGVAALYAICYAAFALAVGMWLFQGRELGGSEG
jgi:ABC-type transport system involved in multi-copper enzyme maturation permease subunit